LKSVTRLKEISYRVCTTDHGHLDLRRAMMLSEFLDKVYFCVINFDCQNAENKYRGLLSCLDPPNDWQPIMKRNKIFLTMLGNKSG